MKAPHRVADSCITRLLTSAEVSFLEGFSGLPGTILCADELVSGIGNSAARNFIFIGNIAAPDKDVSSPNRSSVRDLTTGQVGSEGVGRMILGFLRRHTVVPILTDGAGVLGATGEKVDHHK